MKGWSMAPGRRIGKATCRVTNLLFYIFDLSNKTGRDISRPDE
jgi:hypothetical protein